MTNLSCVFTVRGVIVFDVRDDNKTLRVCNTTPSANARSHSLAVSLLSYRLSNIPGVFMFFKLHILSALDQ